MSYFPVDRSILSSSLWAQGTPEQVKVWFYLLLEADPRSGIVEDADPGIAMRCSLPLDVTTAALDWLASPDSFSRTKDHDGRRIERRPEGGVRILNYILHRDKDYSTPRVQAWRDRRRAEAEAAGETGNGVTGVSETVGNDGHGHGHGQTDNGTRPPAARPRRTTRKATEATPDALEVIRLRAELLGGLTEPTAPKVKAASRALEAGFTVEMVCRAFEAIKAAGEGDPDGRTLAAFCAHRNRAFEYSLRPDVLQKLLDEADAPAPAPASRPTSPEPDGPVFCGERRFK